MEQLLTTIKSQPLYLIILGSLIALIAYSIAKKLLKILAVLALILVVYLGYLVWKGETVTLSRQHLEKYKNERIDDIKKKGPGEVMKLMDRAGKAAK